MSIIVKNLTFSYDEKCLVESLNFDISNGSIGLIKGESGSGKSTLLNVIAGLKKADSGNVVCNNKVYMDENTFLPPERRRIGYVFQDFALFPHINAKKNITYALNKDFPHTNNKWPTQFSKGTGLSMQLFMYVAPKKNKKKG